MRTIEEMLEELDRNDCKHDFEDKPRGFTCGGIFGRNTIPVFKKCGEAWAKDKGD
jgi:hypothetical protein